ncbi:MAG: glycosyltransferase, partial [Bacteroidota bacterium]
MNVFIIPSWYPSDSFPNAGIFFREQAIALASHLPGVNVGIGTWGSNDPNLWLDFKTLPQWPRKLFDFKGIQSRTTPIRSNCIEYYRPALTWSRRWKAGNIDEIVLQNRLSARAFEEQFGKIDIIHAHVAHPAGYIAMQLSRELGVPYVITEHMSPFPLQDFDPQDRWDRWLKPAYQSAARNVAVSTFLCQRMTARGIKAQVIPNLVDENFFHASTGSYDSHKMV